MVFTGYMCCGEASTSNCVLHWLCHFNSLFTGNSRLFYSTRVSQKIFQEMNFQCIHVQNIHTYKSTYYSSNIISCGFECYCTPFLERRYYLQSTTLSILIWLSRYCLLILCLCSASKQLLVVL